MNTSDKNMKTCENVLKTLCNFCISAASSSALVPCSCSERRPARPPLRHVLGGILSHTFSHFLKLSQTFSNFLKLSLTFSNLLQPSLNLLRTDPGGPGKPGKPYETVRQSVVYVILVFFCPKSHSL